MEEHKDIIIKHIKKRNFEDVYTYALSQLILSNQQEQIEAQANIKQFEEKYGMDYSLFCDQFHTITAFPMFEKEDDSLDWQVEVERLKMAVLDIEELQSKDVKEVKL